MTVVLMSTDTCSLEAGRSANWAADAGVLSVLVFGPKSFTVAL